MESSDAADNGVPVPAGTAAGRRHMLPADVLEDTVKKKILVIDDDANVRRYLTSLFKDSGYDVHVAGNTTEGFDKAKKINPDLITLDIEMPGEWGPRFYQKLTTDQTLKNIPVVVISGLEGHQAAVTNAAASISKPFDPGHLIRTVQEILA